MANPYGGNNSGGLYGGGSRASSPSPHHGGGILHDIMHVLGGVEHGVAHLGGDIKSTALGLPAGLAMTFSHPIRSIEEMGKTTWMDWSPLFHGHVGKWAHNFYAHPLAPLLDVAAVVGIALAPFTGGASLSLDAVDAGFQDASLLGKVAQAAKAGQLEFKTAAGVVVKKDIRRAPAARIRQVALHDLVNRSEAHLPHWFSMAARGERLLNRQVQRRAGALNSQLEREVAQHAQIQAFVDAGHKLSLPEWRSSVLQFNFDQIAHFAYKSPHEALPKSFLFVKDLSSTPAPTRLMTHYGSHVTQLEKRADKAEARDFKSGPPPRPNRLPAHLGGNGAGPREARLRSGLSVAKDVQQRLDRAASKRQIKQSEALTSKATDAESFKTELENLDQKILTDDPNQALRDEHGNFLIVPRHSVKNMGMEGANSISFLLRLFTRPWKLLQVGYAPRMVVNNTVGNVFMTLMEHSPTVVVRGLMDAFRQSRNLKALKNLTDNGATYNPHWAEKHFSDVIHSPSTAMPEGSMSGVKGRLKSGLYPLVHKQEQALKRLSLNATMRGSHQVKDLMKQGKSFDVAVNEALTHDPVLRDQASKRAFDTMGDYRTFSRREVGAREIMPFYSWDKHIVLHTASMLDEHPVKLALLGKEGQAGKDAVESIIGKMPSYVEGVVPLSMLGFGAGKGDKLGVVSTRGLNPYATMGDLAGLVQSLTVGGTPNPGENISSGINPILTHAIERISGHRLGTDVPVSTKGSFLAGILKDTFGSVPETKIPETLIKGAPQPRPNKRTGRAQPFLYSKDVKTQVASLLGVPVKEMSKSRAAALADKENGTKKRKHHSIYG